MPPTGKKKKSSIGPSSSTVQRASTVLDQLNLLRNFVGTISHSESDLTDCLRLSGFDVQAAAELLLTGQYQQSKLQQQKGGRKFSFFASKSTQSFKNGSVAVKSKQPKIQAVKAAAKPTKKVSANSPTAASATATTTAATSKTTQKEKRSNLKKPSVASDKAKQNKVGPSNNNKDHGAASEDENEPMHKLLLCRRWVSDWVITSRHGRVDHMDVLELEFSKQGQPRIGFRGPHGVEGRLPYAMANLLTPLLRLGVLELKAQSLVGTAKPVWGGNLPVDLTIYLTQPRRFFDCMFQHNDKTTKASQYFQQKGADASHGLSNNNINNKKPLGTSDAAFHLLQWAEYGDVPDFQVPDNKNASGPDEDKKPAAISTQGANDDDEDDGGEEEELAELDEDAFEAASLDGSTAQGQALEGSVVNDAAAHAHMPEMDDPAGFADHVSLRPYQKQALFFMMKRESAGESREEIEQQLQLLQELSSEQQKKQKGSASSSSMEDFVVQTKEIVCDIGPVVVTEEGQKKATTLDGEINPVNHPLWKRRYLAETDLSRSICFYVNELLGVATYKPPEPPTPCSGGCLADAMGLGKTIMILALILKSKEARSAKKQGPTATLVVAKLSLLPQWEEELKTKTNLSYRVFYGAGKLPSVSDLEGVDVVVTTYGMIQGELRRKNPVLSKCNWLRVVLDEAHCIRNQRTLAAKGCCTLKAEHRWCVSGTIIQNSLDDVFGIMKFLRHEPWCLPAFWKAAITEPARADGTESDPQRREESLRVALDRVRRLLGPIMLRRTKDSVTKDGKPIITLPPIETKTIKVDFSESEREFYSAVLARSQEVFEGYVESNTASQAYFQIFSLLQRLRQTCDHISLTVKAKLDDDEEVNGSRDGAVDRKATASASTAKAPKQQKSKPSDALGKHFFDGLLHKFCSKRGSQRDAKKRSADENESPGKRSKDQAYVENVAQTLSQAVEDHSTHLSEECAICLEAPKIDEAVLTPCAHVFCRTCLVNYLCEKARKLEEGAKPGAFVQIIPDGLCPTCQEKVEAKRIIAFSKSSTEDGTGMTSRFLTEMKPPTRTIKKEVRQTEEGNQFAVARQILENAVSGTESSKMTAIMKELKEVWKLDPGSKVLIFSHYLGFLDLLQKQMGKHDIPFFRLDGSLSLNERINVLDQFRSTSQSHLPSSPKAETDCDGIRKGSVLLISMSAGGEGLNIMCASTCFILEPWWTQAKEDQCVNRIHRIGQTAPVVRVRKFICTDSVEERIVELQKRKAYIAGEIYSDAGRSADGGSARLSVDDFRLIFKGR